MATAAEHYQNLLARHYMWMTGLSFADKVREQKSIIESFVGSASGPATFGESRGAALDLGCGPGYQAVALAKLGFAPVIAIDVSAELLDELRAHRGQHPIEAIKADLASLDDIETGSGVALAVCMGDTLTHLESRESVRRIFAAVFHKLARRGIFAITYRDLSHPLTGTDRFIPVKSDDHTIMTCFLEYANDEQVVVNDIVHVRDAQGWKMEKSSYHKLRLAQAWVAATLSEAGFNVVSQGMAGRLVSIVAQK